MTCSCSFEDMAETFISCLPVSCGTDGQVRVKFSLLVFVSNCISLPSICSESVCVAASVSMSQLQESSI